MQLLKVKQMVNSREQNETQMGQNYTSGFFFFSYNLPASKVPRGYINFNCLF